MKKEVKKKKKCIYAFAIKYGFFDCDFAEVRFTTDVYIYCHLNIPNTQCKFELKEYKIF